MKSQDGSHGSILLIIPYRIKRTMPNMNKTAIMNIIIRMIFTSFGCLSLSKNSGSTIILITIKMINGARNPSQKLSYFQ